MILERHEHDHERAARVVAAAVVTSGRRVVQRARQSTVGSEGVVADCDTKRAHRLERRLNARCRHVEVQRRQQLDNRRPQTRDSRQPIVKTVARPSLVVDGRWLLSSPTIAVGTFWLTNTRKNTRRRRLRSTPVAVLWPPPTLASDKS